MPLADIRFTLRHLAHLDDLGTLPAFADADFEVVDGLLEEAARFFENVVAPTNHEGDVEGCHRNDDGSVTVPAGVEAAYTRFVEAGWGGVGFPEDYGGGGYPWLLALAIEEMLTSANMAFGLFPMLTQGSIEAVLQHGSEQQKEIFLRKLITGEWSATMNLTEPHAGSDVGALTTKAVPTGDGTWLITGQKIFITWGEHDLTDNIIHLVLARTPDSPPGTRGISMFLVPKFMINDDGSRGERNDVSCVSIEHKLGIHTSPTCVMSYGDNDGAVGYIIGEEHAGMRAMFTMMNSARLAIGLQGVGVAERAYQLALAHALERRQGRSPDGAKGEASPIVDHPDVRRMLLDMKSTIDAMRGLCYRNAEAIDVARHGADDASRERAEELASLLTPLSKAWCTDLGVELTSIGLQVHGGMGFIEETGAAQHFRDARIAPIYEGTNGIQAIDLVGRKLPMRGGGVVKDHLVTIAATTERLAGIEGLEVVGIHLDSALAACVEATDWLLANRDADPAGNLAGATTYLEMLATTTGAQILADAALAARELGDPEVTSDKALLARFFAAHRLARVPGMLAAVTVGAADLTSARERILDG